MWVMGKIEVTAEDHERVDELLKKMLAWVAPQTGVEWLLPGMQLPAVTRVESAPERLCLVPDLEPLALPGLGRCCPS